MTPQYLSLPGGRIHLSHGPIDLIIQAEGTPEAVEAAHEAARTRFSSVLSELVSELPLLQRRVQEERCPEGEIARRMWEACLPYRSEYVTPMAAVAGSVAETILACYAKPGIRRAAVNNGGDIALHLGANASYRVGMCTDLARATLEARHDDVKPELCFMINSTSTVRGIATSGWQGRSFSLGIADSVTVLATSAARADVAATMIANAVNVADPRIRRAPANTLKDNTDLGAIPVTVDVPRLDEETISRALRAGVSRAHSLQSAGLIEDAVLVCQGRHVHLNPGDATQAFAPAAARLEPAPQSVTTLNEAKTARTL